jgi:sec-independent protein translocase protein TatC
MTSLTVSIWSAIAVALPVILWQIWGFLAPAFEEKDQKAVSRLVMFSGALFLAGIAFGRFVVLPAAIPFLLGYDSELYNIQVRAREYISFGLVTMIGVGFVFQLPVVVLTLVRLGILTAARLRRNRRIGIVICVAVAVALPGIDPVTTVIECLPLLLLFEGSIWLAGYFEKRWLAQAAARAAAEAEELAQSGSTP